MGILDGRADLHEKCQSVADRKLVSVAIFGNRPAFNQFHYQVRSSVFGGASIQQTGNVGMIESGQNLPLALEAGDDKIGILAGTNQLQRDFFLVVIVVADGAIHFAHATGADLLENFVGSDTAPNPSAGLFRKNVRGCGCKGSVVEKLWTELRFVEQQKFDI